MKSKLCWIPFIPCTLFAIAVKVMQSFSIVFSPDSTIPSYIAVASVLLMFVLNIIFVAADRKTSPVYILSKNVPATVFAMLAAAMIASKASLTAILSLQNGSFGAFTFAQVAFGVLAAICFVIIALAHLQGRNFLPRMGAFLLSMPIWGALMLIGEFLDNRTVSVITIEPIKLFIYAFLMIFTFKLSMIIATINGKNPVKASFLYGLPLAGLGIVVGIKNIISLVLKGLDYSENVIGFAFLSIALYVIFFNLELTKKTLTKEEQMVQFDLDDFDEDERVYGAYQDNYVVAPEEQTGDYDYDYGITGEDAETYVTSSDDSYTDDYDYSYGAENDVDDLVVAPDDDGDDAIYVEKDVVETFEEGVVESNRELIAEEERTTEQLKKIDDLIADINRSE